ncbi:MAG: response regulator [Thermodesulfobacteriota bacterium]
MQILIVDDETIVLDSCKRILEAEGHVVTLAASAGTALEAIGAERFALVFMDIKMPGRDGLSLMREVKKKWPQIPIIAMSGYATPETIDEVSRTGVAKFIAKPFTPDELIEAFRKVIAKEESHGEKEGSGH